MSRYFQYKAVNNLRSELYAPISSTATSLQLKSWEWERRWVSFPIVATLENVDSSWKVAKREIVIITARSWDILTIQRKAFECFPTDDDNVLTFKSRSFDIGDTISNYIAKEYIDNISESIVDLYNNWNDRIFCKDEWWLDISITAWNVRVWSEEFAFAWWTATLTDNTTNYVMIDWAWIIQVDTTWRNQQYTKVATVITSWWNISSIQQWKIDAVWWQMWWWWWFKNISNCVYQKWLLVYFIADWEEYNLTYEKWRVKTITSGEKTYTMTYKWWKLVWSVES